MNNVTGVLRNVELCQIEDTETQFLFGYVVEHTNSRYSVDDWFATSFIVDIIPVGDYYLVKTANSTYRVPGYETINIPLQAITNIRMGTPPKTAINILNGTFGQTLQ